MSTLTIFLNLLLMIINGITALVSFTHYWRIRLEEYLLFTVVFFSAAFYGFYNSILRLIFGESFFVSYWSITSDTILFVRILSYFERISSTLTLFFISLYFTRALWVTSPFKTLTLCFFSLFSNLLINLSIFVKDPVILGMDYQTLTLIADWTLLLPIFLYAALGTYGYRQISPPDLTENIGTATKLWRLQVFSFLAFMIAEIFGRISLTIIPDREILYLPLAYPLQMITAASTFLIVAIIAVRYPEGLLVFHTQLARVKEIYENIVKNGTYSPSYFNSVEEYIRNIPAEIFIDSKTDPLALDL